MRCANADLPRFSAAAIQNANTLFKIFPCSFGWLQNILEDHMTHGSVAHGNSQFFPWHRAYLKALETKMQLYQNWKEEHIVAVELKQQALFTK